jgi:hypothetical protein
MKAKRKWLVAGIALALALALAGALAAPFFIDEPPPDDADLRVARVEVPWEENGFHAFDVGRDDVYLPDGSGEEEAEDPGASELARGDGWDDDLARDVLERNAAVLRKLEACLERPKLRFPVEEGDEARPRTPSFLGAAEVLLIRARSRLREGKHEDGARDVERVIRLGWRIQAAGERILGHMIGRAIEGLGLGALRDLAESQDVDPVLLAPLARDVGSASSSKAARESLKAEYGAFSSYIDRVLSDQFLAVTLVDVPSIWRDPLFLKPNASRRLLAEKLRILSRNLELPLLERTNLRLEALGSDGMRRWFPRPNAVGRSVVASVLVGLERGLADTADLDLSRAFTATSIALRCWRARHGALPPTLDALVPEYLEAVPRDPYDGKPVRYSAEKRIVYSVGNDGKDSGGLDDPDTDDASVYRREPTRRIGVPSRGS